MQRLPDGAAGAAGTTRRNDRRARAKRKCRRTPVERRAGPGGEVPWPKLGSGRHRRDAAASAHADRRGPMTVLQGAARGAQGQGCWWRARNRVTTGERCRRSAGRGLSWPRRGAHERGAQASSDDERVQQSAEGATGAGDVSVDASAEQLATGDAGGELDARNTCPKT